MKKRISVQTDVAFCHVRCSCSDNIPPPRVTLPSSAVPVQFASRCLKWPPVQRDYFGCVYSTEQFQSSFSAVPKSAIFIDWIEGMIFNFQCVFHWAFQCSFRAVPKSVIFINWMKGTILIEPARIPLGFSVRFQFASRFVKWPPVNEEFISGLFIPQSSFRAVSEQFQSS